MLAAGALLGIALAVAPAPSATARIHVDLNVFVDALSPHGDWFDYPGYGSAWRPGYVGRDWRPYTEGRWVWSDDYGWVWDEDEEWGWATYHYGRWLFDDGYGWVWIPGYEWAPAWVRWRHGPSYVGWYPVPPVGISIGFAPSHWIFVSYGDFFRPRLREVVFRPSRRIYDECRHEIRMDRHHGGWYNRGADRHRIERVARERAPVVRVRDVDRPQSARFVRGGGGRNDREQGELRVYRPNVRQASGDRSIDRSRLTPRSELTRVEPSLEPRGASDRPAAGERRERTRDRDRTALARPEPMPQREATPQPKLRAPERSREIERAPRSNDRALEQRAMREPRAMQPRAPQPAPQWQPPRQPAPERVRSRERERSQSEARAAVPAPPQKLERSGGGRGADPGRSREQARPQRAPAQREAPQAPAAMERGGPVHRR